MKRCIEVNFDIADQALRGGEIWPEVLGFSCFVFWTFNLNIKINSRLEVVQGSKTQYLFHSFTPPLQKFFDFALSLVINFLEYIQV